MSWRSTAWRLISRLRRRRARFPIVSPFPNGTLDEVRVEPSGQIELLGWTRDPETLPQFEVRVDASPADPRNGFSFPRAVDAAIVGAPDTMIGFVLRFSAPATASRIGEVAVISGGREIARFRAGIPLQAPDYAGLFDEREVLHRDQIYGYGPPSAAVNGDLLALAIRLPAPVLDFGCGSGALVRALRQAGIEARGIELDRPEIRQSLREDVRSFITLYDGRMPLPVPDGEFASVVCSEVLEHIPDFRAAAGEMARVAKLALVTVPDMSAIPALFPHFVVPWHLLEATHVNFFTQASLEALLGKHFGGLRFSRIGPIEVNGTRVFTSLVAQCSR